MNIKQTIAGVVIAGAGFAGGIANSIDAKETKTFDVTNARTVNEVRIKHTIVAPATTEETYTINDLTSEIDMLNTQITALTARRDALVAKKADALSEAQAEFDKKEDKILE